ncbi:MAG: ATP-binding protein [Hydrococcus sp. RU_2_2]|nr:ATP-binding protein [Hydrococcus sp. RU_2_2]NJP22339.1 ATP-binding protein [Hydrococcus sp. CRU_1_1]
MDDFLASNLKIEAQEKLITFKEYAVSHPHLAQIDSGLMRAIVEPAGFAHVLVYGPSGVGKTTMINHLAKRLNEITTSNSTGKRTRTTKTHLPQLPLLLLETRPPDGGAFNRADYYRTALKQLGEQSYERRLLVDLDTEQTWSKKGRTRTKTTQFNDSPELRHALEDAFAKRGVRAVILDEAQHLMKVGNGQGAGKLLDQLDWIKSITNVTGVLHILIGTYELLNFQNLSGQASRRGLDLHFPRYLFQDEQDRKDFQGVLLALLKQVPLDTDLSALMQEWFYFYERSIGCVGVLKNWLIRTVAATLHDGGDTLTRERLQENALSLAQCERMAIDAVEGEQKLSYMASRHEHLWRLLQMETTVPPGASAEEELAKTTRKKRSSSSKSPVANDNEPVSSKQTTPKKRQSRKKATTVSVIETVEDETGEETSPARYVRNEQSLDNVVNQHSQPVEPEVVSLPKKSARRVGQRKQGRDKVGLEEG